MVLSRLMKYGDVRILISFNSASTISAPDANIGRVKTIGSCFTCKTQLYRLIKMEQSCKHQFIIRERPLTDLRQHSHCDVYGRAHQMLDVCKHLRDVSSQ